MVGETNMNRMIKGFGAGGVEDSWLVACPIEAQELATQTGKGSAAKKTGNYVYSTGAHRGDIRRVEEQKYSDRDNGQNNEEAPGTQ